MSEFKLWYGHLILHMLILLLLLLSALYMWIYCLSFCPGRRVPPTLLFLFLFERVFLWNFPHLNRGSKDWRCHIIQIHLWFQSVYIRFTSQNVIAQIYPMLGLRPSLEMVSKLPVHLTSMLFKCLVTVCAVMLLSWVWYVSLLLHCGLPKDTGREWNSFLIQSWSDQWLLCYMPSIFTYFHEVLLLLALPLVFLFCLSPSLSPSLMYSISVSVL